MGTNVGFSDGVGFRFEGATGRTVETWYDRYKNHGDFVAAFKDSGYEAEARNAIGTVPEPSSLVLLMFLLISVAPIRRN